MDRGKFKLREKEINEKELIEIIKEKELEINEYKRKLKLAEEEIENIKIELKNLKQEINNSIEVGFDIKEWKEENKGPIATLVLGEDAIQYDEVEECSEAINEEKVNDNKNDIEIIDESSKESIEYILDMSEDINNINFENIDNVKLEDVYQENDLINSTDENEEKNKDLLENLKLSFIENKNYKCIESLNAILENIKNIEDVFTYEDSIILMYLSYFYNKLEELLNKSEVINNYYLSESNEIKLLKILLAEKDYPIYKEVKECVHIVLKSNKNLFKTLDTMIKVRIIDKINNISYRSFEVVYSVNSIEYGEETINIKAWVKEKNGFIWRLVEGLYSNSKEKLYMLESSIYVLKLNINESIKEEKQYQKDLLITKKESEGENVVKNKIDSNNQVNKEKQIGNNAVENTLVSKSIILESQSDGIEDNHNKWRSLKEKIVLKFKKMDNK